MLFAINPQLSTQSKDLKFEIEMGSSYMELMSNPIFEGVQILVIKRSNDCI